ncbi:hypothetical protein LZ30DRAFT_160223 [Colletotrichum cereale]|nr:hypothetical protein LZ30DRAFT_160223 [Colletotrichum cereale]
MPEVEDGMTAMTTAYGPRPTRSCNVLGCLANLIVRWRRWCVVLLIRRAEVLIISVHHCQSLTIQDINGHLTEKSTSVVSEQLFAVYYRPMYGKASLTHLGLPTASCLPIVTAAAAALNKAFGTRHTHALTRYIFGAGGSLGPQKSSNPLLFPSCARRIPMTRPDDPQRTQPSHSQAPHQAPPHPSNTDP